MTLEDRGLVGLDDDFAQGPLGYVMAPFFVAPVADVLGAACFLKDDLFGWLADGEDRIDREVCGKIQAACDLTLAVTGEDADAIACICS